MQSGRGYGIIRKTVFGTQSEEGGIMRERGIFWLRICLFALSALFLALGVLNGGARDVFAKAAAVCSECIGLG